MRLAILFLLVPGPGCAGLKKASTEISRFNGTWLPVKQESGCKTLPEAPFEGQKLIINDSSYRIYENGLLINCYDLSGKGYPETFVTTGNPIYFISVFKKE